MYIYRKSTVNINVLKTTSQTDLEAWPDNKKMPFQRYCDRKVKVDIVDPP